MKHLYITSTILLIISLYVYTIQTYAEDLHGDYPSLAPRFSSLSQEAGESREEYHQRVKQKYLEEIWAWHDSIKAIDESLALEIKVGETTTDFIIRQQKVLLKWYEQEFGTAREVAKRCSDFELKTESMTTMYCLPLFRNAISVSRISTGCTVTVTDEFRETYFLVREELRSLWFFDRRSFLSVVEKVLRDNYPCTARN